jgi:TRAP-type C4-dicarboxylate transport system substrate-binding protein
MIEKALWFVGHHDMCERIINQEENAMRKSATGISMLLGLVCICIFTLSTITFAQDKVIELRYASQYAPTHPYSMADLKWIEKIEKETNGRVKIKPYWNGTLISGRESMRELATGVADIAFVTPIYEKSGVDLVKAMVDFYKDSDPMVMSRIYWELYNKFPEIRKEMESVKILALNCGIPMSLMTVKKPVKTIDDLKGMRVRITGDVTMRTFKVLGAEPVGMPVTEMLESLQKGIIQGVIFSRGDYKSLRLAETVKYETTNINQDRGPYVSRAMNKDTFNKLPADIQKVFDANRDFWTEATTREMFTPEKEGEALAVKAGVQFVKVDQASEQKYDATFEEENLKEAKMLDAKGLPGTKIYTEARRLVKLYNKK